MDIIHNKVLMKYMVTELDKAYPSKRNHTFSNEYYLKNILHVLHGCVNWNFLKNLHIDKSPYHYKSIQNKFLKWSKDGFFKKLFDKLLVEDYVKPNKNIDLFIDSTMVNNSKGRDLIGVNPLYKKKKVTKISCVIDIKKHILAVVPFVSTKHDSTTVVDTLNAVPISLKPQKHCRLNLIGDAAYLNTKKYYTYGEKKINLITPYRKNMNRHHSLFDRSKLRSRFRVEHTFQQLKKYNRINLRQDKLLCTYMNFMYMACFIENFKLMKK